MRNMGRDNPAALKQVAAAGGFRAMGGQLFRSDAAQYAWLCRNTRRLRARTEKKEKTVLTLKKLTLRGLDKDGWVVLHAVMASPRGAVAIVRVRPDDSCAPEVNVPRDVKAEDVLALLQSDQNLEAFEDLLAEAGRQIEAGEIRFLEHGV